MLSVRFRYCILALGLIFVSGVSQANSADDWDKLSHLTTYGLVAAAGAVPVYKGDWQGLEQAGFSIGAGAGVGLVTKSLVSETRPDKSDNDSFPSNHAVNSFSSATTLYLRYGWQYGLPAYSVASLSAYARVEADQHYWKDVLAGAVIGTVSAWVFTDALDDNVQLTPWIVKDEVGLSVSVQF